MATTRSISAPFPYYTDIDGSPLEAGYVYIGEENKNPEIYPLDVYWDQALTIVAAQPIRTINGYPARNGSPGALYVDTDYSSTVRNKNLVLVYTALTSVEAVDVSEKIDFSYIESTTHNMGNDADYTLTASENTYGRVVITDTGVVLTTAQNIVVGTDQRRIIVQNDTAQTLTFKTAAGTGIAIIAGTLGDIYSDGTNIIKATDKIDEIYLQTTTHNMASDANYTLADDENAYGRITITDTGTALTAARDIIVDVSERRFLVQNDTLQELTFKTSAGTGISVVNGELGDLYCDGTDVIEVSVPTTSELLAEHEVTGSAVTSIDFSGLDIDTHKSYVAEIEILNATGSLTNLYCYVNNDTVDANYDYTMIVGSTVSVGPAFGSLPRAFFVYANQRTSANMNITKVDGLPFCGTTASARVDSAVMAVFFSAISKTSGGSNITQLTFTSTVANAIGVGSRIRIYRRDV